MRPRRLNYQYGRSFYSIFEREMKGVCQRRAEIHLHRYLAEFDFPCSTRIVLGRRRNAFEQSNEGRRWKAVDVSQTWQRAQISSERANPCGGRRKLIAVVIRFRKKRLLSVPVKFLLEISNVRALRTFKFFEDP
jgi:hypothetical protein